MSAKSKKTPLIQSGWLPKGSIYLRRYRSGFAQLKEMFGNETMKTHKEKLSTEPLTKEEKRKIKEKIRAQIQKQNTKKIIAGIIALILTVIFFLIVITVMSNYYLK